MKSFLRYLPTRKRLKAIWLYRTLPLLLNVSVWLKWPYGTALVMCWSTTSVNQSGEVSVLCIGRSIFMDDVKAMATFGRRIQYKVIQLSTLQKLFDCFVNGIAAKELGEHNYHHHDASARSRQRYYAYLKKAMPIFKKFIRFDAILSGNFAYMPQQEVARACEVLHIPFVVLHKEAIVVPSAYREFLKIYKNSRFIGDKMLFYNNKCLEGFLELPVVGLTREKTELVGIPRFDTYFLQNGRHHPLRSQVLFFAFVPRLSFRFLTSNSEKLNAVEVRARSFYLAIKEFAKRHKETTVVVKTKRADHFVEHAKDILSLNDAERIENLVLTNVGDPSTLIRDSSLVIGFNSTTLIEALIMGKIIVSPFFGDIMDGEPWTFFENYPELVNYAHSENELSEYFLQPDKYGHYEPKLQEAFLGEYISVTRGGASVRAEKAILGVIESFV